MISSKLGIHGAPTSTHRSVTGQHTWPFLQLDALPLQKIPGTGVKQCFASGQQYDPWSWHGDTQASPTFTHIFNNGQHTSLLGHDDDRQDVWVGVKQCFASGQQYWSLLHFIAVHVLPSPQLMAREVSFQTPVKSVGPPICSKIFKVRHTS